MFLFSSSCSDPRLSAKIRGQILFLILQHLQRGVPSRCAHDAAARMRGRTTHVKVANRRAVLRPARRRSQKEELLQSQFALKDVALRQTKVALQIQRCQNLSV